MANLFVKEIQELQELTHKRVDELIRVWMRIFTVERCHEHSQKLILHFNQVYKELIKESLEKQECYEKEIQDLYAEAEMLKRLLHKDIQLPQKNDERPLEVIQNEIDFNLIELRECLRLRKEIICELLLEQDELCEELGAEPKELLADPLPTEQKINEFRQHLEELRSLRVTRLNEITTLRREIKEMLKVLGLHIKTDAQHELLNDRQIKLDNNTFKKLKQMHVDYSEEIQQLHTCIDGIRNKLEMLWQRLDTSPNTRCKYRELKDYNYHTYDTISVELQRCENLKKQNIKKYVEQVREELLEWWDKTMKSEQERKRFTPFYNYCYTDDLLVLHEMELEDLKKHYECNSHIFELYAERQKLWERMIALEAKANDPGRFNNRGGQLLREEKERKTIAIKFPKIEQQITELVKEYEQRENKEFLIYGENILNIINAQWEEKRQQKEQQSSARKQRTPLTGRTPLSLKNVSQAIGGSMVSLRHMRTPSTQTKIRPMTVSSQKRKLNVREKLIPNAKRSLLHTLESPKMLLRPPTAMDNTTATISSANSIKSPQKKLNNSKKIPRVFGSIIKRRSNPIIKKRNSGGRVATPARLPPKIQIIDTEMVNFNDDDAYKAFMESVGYRSSLLQQNNGRKKQLLLCPDDKEEHRENVNSTSDNKRMPRIPTPRLANANHKRATKNLPIMF